MRKKIHQKEERNQIRLVKAVEKAAKQAAVGERKRLKVAQKAELEELMKKHRMVLGRI